MIGVVGGSGFYEFLSDDARARRRHAVRPARGAGAHRHDRRARCRLPAQARAPPRVRRPPGAVPGEPVGAALAGRHRPDRALLGRFAAARPPSRADWWSSTSSSTAPGVGPTRSTTSRPCTTRASPTRIDAGAAGGAGRRRPPHRRRCRRRRHDGGDQRPELLHPRREPLVPPDGMARGQHDRLPRGGARRRARHPLRDRWRWSPTTTRASTATSR